LDGVGHSGVEIELFCPFVLKASTFVKL